MYTGYISILIIGEYYWDVYGLGRTEVDKGQYAEGYAAEWKKGQHNPDRTGFDRK